MATIGNSFPNLIDHFKATDKNGNYIDVIEALTNLNPLMQDAYVEEANQGFKHTSVIRTSLPTPTWGKLYQGIPQTKSTKEQVEDATGFVESLSTVDMRLDIYRTNPARARADEAAAHMEAMAQDVQANFFYSDTATTPERFKGLAARYNTLVGNANGVKQVVDAGGAGSDNTSIWFVTWGRGKTSLFYPKGSKAGIVRKDMGTQRTLDDLNNPYYVEEEYFRQDIGVAVGDWRYNSRIANIDVSDMIAGSVDIYALLRRGYYRMQGRRTPQQQSNALNPLMGSYKTVIYANSTVIEALDVQSTNDNKLELRPSELEGKEIKTWRGIPIRETDAIINAESRVV